VVAVPLDTSRRRARGYNQAELLAEVVARRLEIALLRRACHRSRPTTPQSGLSKAQRRTNVHEAFQADRRLVEGRMILLVDDVMTTGATVNACALALLAAGAARVAVLTAARTPGMA
jgi:ComF family protein